MSRRSINSANLFLSASSSTQNDSSAATENSKASSENQATPARVARASAPEYPLVLLIGGSGFLGSEIRHQLQERGVRYIATSTSNTAAGNKDDEFVPLDLTASDAGEQFYQLISTSVKSSDNPNRIAVISAMGAIGTDKDEQVNAALAAAIRASHRANDGDKDVVERFVMIGNTDRVRRLARNVSFLKGYASGKDEAESSLRKCFGSQGCIIKPSFIYGGDAISLQPPRLPTGLGSLASEILGLYPIQSLADALPDALALPLAPPVSVEIVASAAVNIALGIVEGYTEELAGEAITMAGSVRTWKEKSRYENWLKEELEKDGVVYNRSSKESCSIDAVSEIDEERRWKRINVLKERLLRGDSASVDSDSIDDEVAIMEELECLRPLSMKPANDPKLNGQWNFVLSKDDLGTQLIKELLPPDYYSFGNAEVPDDDSAETSKSPPWKLLLGNLYQLKGLYMRIHDEQSQVDIVLSSNIFFGKIPIDIVFSTSLLSTNYDDETEGTLFLEKFESIEVGGISLPLPSSWQRFRYLEITYLDEEIVIARGSGGEPHVLVRANE
eukprot:CAMPEP_0202002460 /NCGR_PEP_ID=MMETSP0905-20130828/8294_1 /ASSEMBLY_ACC=CAM_ASM_000554 /TAXON_ID=420261 /ORGANISM="Thalassiosira antarctica, Strain CCMP982" /LENGTH=558 /DNA_ID=CAMNT_0048559365 /DNA_START=240 /DNA_END=1916 /DNA_ORIENTATION=+